MKAGASSAMAVPSIVVKISAAESAAALADVARKRIVDLLIACSFGGAPSGYRAGKK
jgi:hypothetical protein